MTQAPDDSPRGEAAESAAFQLSYLYHDVAAITRSLFVDICRAVRSWPADFRSVLKGLVPGDDAIVNFNWDEEVDFFLTMKRDTRVTQYEVAYTANSWKKNHFLILKPRGSIGWYDVAQGIDNDKTYFIADHSDDRIPRFEKRLVSYDEFELPQDIEDGPGDGQGEFVFSCPPVITPPTFGKQFPYREQTLIWQDVIDVCRHADEFVFLGYSVPPDDFLTRAAIRCAISEPKNEDRKTKRCLVVTKLARDDKKAQAAVITNFRTVFGNSFEKKNLLRRTIGDTRAKSDLFDTIIRRLDGATV
jgi:hypothetical protein